MYRLLNTEADVSDMDVSSVQLFSHLWCLLTLTALPSRLYLVAVGVSALILTVAMPWLWPCRSIYPASLQGVCLLLGPS